jgi:hypothetical protein
MDQPMETVKCDSCGTEAPLIAFRGRMLCVHCYHPARERFHARRAALEADNAAWAAVRVPKRPPQVARTPEADTIEEAQQRPEKKPNWLLRALDWVFGFDGRCKQDATKQDAKGSSDE